MSKANLTLTKQKSKAGSLTQALYIMKKSQKIVKRWWTRQAITIMKFAAIIILNNLIL